MPKYIIHDGTKIINKVLANSIDDISIPSGCVCIDDISLENYQVITFEGGELVLKYDYTNIVYYDETTKEKKYVTEIGEEPDPSWIEWKGCFDCWIEHTVKPERKRIMDEYEWRYNRLDREISLSLPVTLTREHIDNYMHQVHMFPDGLTEIVDPIIWPTPPDE